MHGFEVQPVRSIPDWLRGRAIHYPDHPALVAPEGTWTYRELYDAACEYAASLRILGVTEGDRVAVIAKTGVKYALMMHAIMQLNAVVVPLNWRLTGRELAKQVEDAEVAILLFDEGGATLARDVLQHVQPRYGGRAFESIERTAERVERSDIELTHMHAIIYTSGTTGVAKGAVLTYQNHWWGAMASAMQLGLTPVDRWLVPMPLFHVGGMAVLIRSLIYGTTVVIHNGFDVSAVNEALDSGDITMVSVVPTMLQRLIEHRRVGYPKALRCVLLGGSAAPKSLVARALALGIPVNQSYGMTETNTQATTLQSADALRKVGSSGKPLANMRVRIATPDGFTDEAFVEGEIVVQGPTVISGYWKRPDANAKSFRDGWFYTGDIGVFDEEGFLYVLDRRADLIVSGGENIYPAEVESVLVQYEGVREAAVVGQSDPTWGQVPVAFVVKATEVELTECALANHCRQLLAGYKVPKAFYFVDELPRNASGKLLRRILKERLQ
ncbi:2-succinylbenzoate--CoA ligase [Alicyclobacillus acidoterrestris]|uniref:o-succinylbenzoate--CoA ligase n=1 Tax=Alicyclobacillus suci TaxID=2816080 RepID=UPI00119702DD|nr:o-succinylbenzoate--CoA ligase [Alicyclobacillus suci]GEO26948.1 2-succinylbenzoate--CoA ligase [Alicyclobacillus acidoterrestris]